MHFRLYYIGTWIVTVALPWVNGLTTSEYVPSDSSILGLPPWMFIYFVLLYTPSWITGLENLLRTEYIQASN